MANLELCLCLGIILFNCTAGITFGISNNLSSANLNSLNSPRNTYPEYTNAGKKIVFSLKINLVMQKPGSWGTSLPCQVLRALQGAEAGQQWARRKLFKHHLQSVRVWLCCSNSCGCIVWELSRALAHPALAQQLSLVPQCPALECPAGTFGNTGQGELVSAKLDIWCC